MDGDPLEPVTRTALLSGRTVRRFERGLFGVPHGRAVGTLEGQKPKGATGGVLVATPDAATDSAVEQSLEVDGKPEESDPVRQRTAFETQARRTARRQRPR
jgi:hypothetical protein